MERHLHMGADALNQRLLTQYRWEERQGGVGSFVDWVAVVEKILSVHKHSMCKYHT